MHMRAPARLLAVVLFAFAIVFVPASFPATKKPPAHPIDINSASSVQLQEVPGIGPATAEKILQMRKSYGAFKSVDDLMAVRGIGPKRLEKMRKYLVAGHGAQQRRGAGAPPSAKTRAAATPPACASCSRPAPKTKAGVATEKSSKPAGADGDGAEADEEPE